MFTNLCSSSSQHHAPFTRGGGGGGGGTKILPRQAHNILILKNEKSSTCDWYIYIYKRLQYPHINILFFIYVNCKVCL